MERSKRRRKLREKRHRRVRSKVEGTPDRPRLCVNRCSKHIYAQVIDDWSQHTLAAASTLSPELRQEVAEATPTEAAGRVGELIGKKCLEKGIEAVVFDRGGYRYHGRVKALAEGARKQFEQAGAEGF